MLAMSSTVFSSTKAASSAASATACCACKTQSEISAPNAQEVRVNVFKPAPGITPGAADAPERTPPFHKPAAANAANPPVPASRRKRRREGEFSDISEDPYGAKQLRLYKTVSGGQVIINEISKLPKHVKAY